jgi:hypothetical protein
MASEDWTDLARLFRDVLSRYSDFHHFSVELPTPMEVPERVAGESPEAALERAGKRIRSNPVLQIYMSMISNMLYWPFIGEWCFPRQAQFFYGGSNDPSVFVGRRQTFARLARTGVVLASESGLINEPLPPDRGPTIYQANAWNAMWMNVVYQQARQRKPGSLLRVDECSDWEGRKLPDGVVVANLSVGVILASALAAEQLAQTLKNQILKTHSTGSSSGGAEAAPKPVKLTGRQEIILVAVATLAHSGPGPWRGKKISKAAQLGDDSRVRADLSGLCKLVQSQATCCVRRSSCSQP